MTDKITPCDRIMIPVYLTYRGTDGLRSDKEMFAESNVIVLRWFDDDRQMQQIFALRPHAWRDGRNYFDPDTRKWKYD